MNNRRLYTPKPGYAPLLAMMIVGAAAMMLAYLNPPKNCPAPASPVYATPPGAMYDI